MNVMTLKPFSLQIKNRVRFLTAGSHAQPCYLLVTNKCAGRRVLVVTESGLEATPGGGGGAYCLDQRAAKWTSCVPRWAGEQL